MCTYPGPTSHPILGDVQLISHIRRLQQKRHLEWVCTLCPSASTGSQVQLTTPWLPNAHTSSVGLCGRVVQVSATQRVVSLDRLPNSGCWLRSGFETPRRQLVVSLFQDPSSYGRFIGATLNVPCLD